MIIKKLNRNIKIFLNFLRYYFIWFFTRRAGRVDFINVFKTFQDRTELNKIFPTLELTEIFPESKQIDISLQNFNYRGGNISFGELTAIAAIVKLTNPKTIFEFGTFDGTTTLQMALNSADDTKIYTLNISPDTQKSHLRSDSGDVLFKDKFIIGEKFLNNNSSKKINQIIADSALYNYSPHYNSIGLIFIDGSHSYEYVKNDTEQALKMIKNGGLILWHDYLVWNGVSDYLNELCYKIKLVHIKGTSLVISRIEK